jgi:Fic family protein
MSVFTVDFLCIRPFDEGNGRIARLMAELMLEKAGFHVARYESIDRVIESSGMDYYDALNACVNQWDQARNDYSPYVEYWLGVIHETYQRLFEKMDLLMSANNSKSARVRLFVRQKRDGVTKRQIREAFPDISEATVENALGKMVKEGEIQKVGAGRATSYRVVD